MANGAAFTNIIYKLFNLEYCKSRTVCHYIHFFVLVTYT